MIYNLLKRILISFFIFGLLYALLQVQPVQISLLRTAVKFCTPYKISLIKLRRTYQFPFALNITEVSVTNKKQIVATLRDVTWKINDFSFNKINLNIGEINVLPSIESDKFNFSNVSPASIACSLHNFSNYLQWFENVDVAKLNFDQKKISLNLKRQSNASVLQIIHNDEELTLELTPLSDHTQLQINGLWLTHKLSLIAQIYENSINFLGTANVCAFFPEHFSHFLKEDVSITALLVKSPEWQLKPFKITTSSGHVLTGECGIEDSNNLKLRAKLHANANNRATIDVSINLEPFEINGFSEIEADDLEVFLKPFLPGAKGHLNFKASLSKVKDFDQGVINLHGQGVVHSNDFHLPLNVSLDLQNGLGHGKFTLTKGKYLNHAFEANVDFDSTAKYLHIQKLKLNLHDLQFALLKPAIYDWQKGLANAKIHFCGGLLELLDFKFADCGTLNLRNIQLEPMKILLGQGSVTGLLNGQIKKISQKPLTAKLDLTQGFWQKYQNREVCKILNNLSAHFDASLDNSIATWKLTVQDQDKINCQSNGKINLETMAVDVHLKGIIRLSLLTDWLATGDRIFGDININLHGKGALENIAFDGSVDADNGLYEHNEVGTFYKDITIRAKAQGRKLVITRFDGKDITGSNDPAYGQLRGEGWVDFSNIFAPIFHVPLYLNHLRISQNDSFTSNASGRLLIAGTGANVNCKGEVTLEDAEYFITENSEKMIPGIVDKKIKQEKVQEKNTGTAFPLDILVHAPPGSFKVMGTGVKTAWFGDIYVKKSIVNPFLVGSVELHEGVLDVLGKVLKVTHGVVTFVDDDRNNPRLNIKAIKDLGEGVVVAIEIKGTGHNTIVDFTSIPSMAKEEVLALLLFGKRLGEVSVLQSIQLAELTKSTSNNKSGFFEKMRSSLGFDQFEFKTTTRGGAAENDKDATPAERAAGKTTQAVRIGKEFGKVQVGIEQGAGSETSKVIVSTPLGKNFALQGDVGGAQNSGVGISWIKRY